MALSNLGNPRATEKRYTNHDIDLNNFLDTLGDDLNNKVKIFTFLPPIDISLTHLSLYNDTFPECSWTIQDIDSKFDAMVAVLSELKKDRLL